MYAEATRTIDREVALKIVEETIENIMAEVNDNPNEHCTCYEHSNICSCEARYWSAEISVDRISCTLDYTGATFGFSFPGPDLVEFFSHTCGGHTHALHINVETGTLVVIHDGARRSYGPQLGHYISRLYIGGMENGVDFGQGLDEAKDWTLQKIESSQPEWAVPFGLLRGQIGSGPTTLEEAENMVSLKRGEIFRQKLKTIRYEDIPDNIWGNKDGSFKADGHGRSGDLIEPFMPRFTGEHYKRAAAQGIKL